MPWDAFRERGHDIRCADVDRALGMGSSDLVKALSESGTDPGRAVMVGDAVWDMIAAGRAGIRGIGLLSGGITEADLRDAGATEIYADAADLLGKIPASAISQLAERTGE